MRSIVHLDADAFFASVEQAADPRLRGRPMAVGGEKRGIIASASYEARQYGVYTPMPTARARKLCPKLIVVPGDFEKYERFSQWMFSYAYDFTPDVEISSIDEGYFELTHARHAPRDVAERVRAAIGGALKISVSEGIGSNKLVSQIASKLRKPAALVQVLPNQERSFLRPLPVRWLPGIGPKGSERLHRAGLTRIGQVAATDVDCLALLVGAMAPQLRRFAHGEDDSPLQPQQAPAKSYSQQTTFEEDLTREDLAEATLRRMADELAQHLRRDGKMARTVTVKLKYNDFAQHQASESLQEPTDLETDLYGRLRSLLRHAWRRRVSLRMVSLRLSNLYDAVVRPELLLELEPVPSGAYRHLARALDEVRERRGRYAVMRGHDLLLRATASPAEPAPGLPTPKPNHGSKPRRMRFVPLHVHSYYSFMNSTLTVEEAVARAAGHGLPALALTDEGNLHGAVPFQQAARAAGIKPILGAKIWVGGEPLLLYVEDATGYRNLCRVLSAGPRHRRDRFQFDTAGLVAVGASSAMAEQFAPDAFYLGAGHPRAIERYGPSGPLRWVAVPAVHYAEPADRHAHRAVQSIRTRTLLDHPHPLKKTRGSYHLARPDEMGAWFRDHPAAMARTLEIAERCTFALELGRLQFPSYRPPGGSTPQAFLRDLVRTGLRRRYGSRAVATGRQAREELAIIEEVGYSEYFLAVWDLLQDCRREGIEWLTRGSAADSLVCYCLGISDICPLRFKLYFRRFLNRERMQMNKLPDIDIDFAHDRKDDVVNLIFRKYGTAHAAVVGGFSTYQARSAFADVAKVLGVSEHQVRRITEHIPFSRARDLTWVVRECRECRDLPLKEEPYATALRLAERLHGFPRHAKMHPCGIVLSRQPMDELVPCFTSGKGYPTTHFDMNAVEAIGLVKLDILAQGGLAVLRDVRKSLDARGVQVDLAALEPWRDPAVWNMVSGGQARAVHHIESPAMISLSRMCDVRDIDTLVAVVSVIRPGAANEQKKVRFTRRYQGMEPVSYPHPSLASCLRGTYGLIVYEEQVLQVCEGFAGLPPGEADQLRRALVKQDRERVQELGIRFAAHAASLQRSPDEIRTVWRFLCGFNGYAFCKAHSAAYAVEAYQAAWLKLNYPAEFMAAVLSNGKGFYHPLVYVLESHRLGVGFRGPDVNDPGPSFQVRDGRIRVPATRTKGLSERTGKRMTDERRRGRFVSLRDFHERVRPSREDAELLLQAGAFDRFGDSRAALFWEILWLHQAIGGPPRREPDSVQPWLMAEPGRRPQPATQLSEPTRRERLQAESELFDFAVTGHPLELHEDVSWDSYCPVSELHRHAGKTVTACGLIVEGRLTQQVTGEPMKFLTLADWTGMVETELFAKTYRRYGLATVRFPVLEVTATVESFDNAQGFTLRVHRAGPPRKRVRERPIRAIGARKPAVKYPAGDGITRSA